MTHRKCFKSQREEYTELKTEVPLYPTTQKCPLSSNLYTKKDQL